MTHRRILALFALIAAAPLVAACGGGGSSPAEADGAGATPTAAASAEPGGLLTVPSDADERTRNEYLTQNLIATCMRKQGFQYTPVIQSFSGADVPIDGQNYKRTKAYRQKYGWGIYAIAVYPDNPDLAGSKANLAKSDSSPDDAYKASLSSAQRAAYDKALGTVRIFAPGPKNDYTTRQTGCVGKAQDKYHPRPRSEAAMEARIAAEKARDRANQQALNGDAQLVALAQSYAQCLRGDGIPVTTTQPTEIGDMVKFSVSAGLKGSPSELPEGEARTQLTHEIHLALQDLECGKAFRAAYFPKLAKHPFTGLNG